MAKASGTQERTGYQTAASDRTEARATEHRSAGQASSSWTQADESNWQKHLRDNRQTEESVSYLQKYNSGRADRENTIDYLMQTARNSDMEPKDKERLEHLHGQSALSGTEAHQYRSLLWQAHGKSEQAYGNVGLDPTAKEQLHLQMLGHIRDQVNEKKAHFDNPATESIITAEQGASSEFWTNYFDSKKDQEQAEAAEAPTDFWSQRALLKQQKEAEGQTSHQPAEQPQAPSHSGMESFISRWVNKPGPAAQSPTPEEGRLSHNPNGAANHQSANDFRNRWADRQENGPGQAQADYDATKFLSALPDTEHRRIDQALNQTLNYTTYHPGKDQDRASFRQELTEGRATADNTTQWLLNNRSFNSLTQDQTDMLNHYHEKQRLDNEELRAYAYLLELSKQAITESMTGPNERDSVAYLDQAVNHMIHQKAADEQLERPLEDNFNIHRHRERTEHQAGSNAESHQSTETPGTWEKLKGLFRRKDETSQ